MVEAIVEFEYTAVEADELTLKKGDRITDVKVQPGGWWQGTLAGKRGMFPDNFVKVVTKSDNMKSATASEVTLRPKSQRRCRVLFSYQPCNEDELRLVVDDVIDVLNEVEDGWWKGRLGETVGVFPSNFVSEILQEEPKRPRPGSREESRKQLLLESESESDKAAPAVSPEPPKPVEVSAPIAATVEPEVPSLPPKPVKEQCRVLFGYDAANTDELSLKEGDIVTVLTRDVQDKGWWRGELNGKVGLFPDNFVELIVEEAPSKPARVAALKPVVASTGSATNKTRETFLRPAVKEPPAPSKKPSLGRKDLVDGPGSSKMAATESLRKSPVPPQELSRLLKPKSDPPEPTTVAAEASSSSFDDVSRAAMLTHVTQSRAKPPARRPPSNTTIGAHKDEGEVKESGSLTNGSSEDVSARKSWERNKAPWMDELKKNQDRKSVPPNRLPRPQSVHADSRQAEVKPTAVKHAGNGVALRTSPARNIQAPVKEDKKEEKLDVNELATLVRHLEASLAQHKEATSREINDLTMKLNEERTKRVQLEVQLNKLTDLVTQV